MGRTVKRKADEVNDQTIFRESRDGKFFTANIKAAQDSSLSWEARGLLHHLLSKPQDWRVIFSQLESEGNAARYRLRKMLDELQEGGYLSRVKKRNAAGHIEFCTMVYASPDLNPHFTSGRKLTTGGGPVVNQPVVNQPPVVHQQLHKRELHKREVTKKRGVVPFAVAKTATAHGNAQLREFSDEELDRYVVLRQRAGLVIKTNRAAYIGGLKKKMSSDLSLQIEEWLSRDEVLQAVDGDDYPDPFAD